MLPAAALSGLEQVDLPSDAVEVGRIRDAWGLMGWFKIMPYSASPEALFSVRRWFVQPPELGRKLFKGTMLLHVREIKKHSDTLVASVHGVTDRTAADALKNTRIFVPRSSFPSLPENEYYWVDLMGLDVFNREGVTLGSVRNIISTGSQEVLIIGYEEAGKRHDRLIPFVAAYVDAVDMSARRIVVDWQPDY